MALMPVAAALDQLRCATTPLTETETLALADALGRVLAADQFAAVDVPPADNSAMDGYAVASADVTKDSPVTLAVSQRVPAGAAPSPLEPGTAARVFTGGPLPAGADTVVIQEDCEAIADGRRVRIPAGIVAGNHVRTRGQDMREGTRVLSRGEHLRPPQLGVLAATGIARVPVYRKLRVAIISTGSELIDPGDRLQPGQIYNSNLTTLNGLLAQLNCEVVIATSVPDERVATVERISAAAQAADVVITCGGVSVGEEDHVKPAIEQLGTLDIWKLAIKPGKPMAYGQIGDAPVFGLPGNPVSVFVTFQILVRPCLLAMQGRGWQEPTSRRVVAGFSRRANSSRQEYLRVRIVRDEFGEDRLEEFSTQDSSVLTSIAWANALAIVPIATAIKEGDLLETLAFEQF